MPGSMRGVLDKIARRFEEEGPRHALRTLYDDALLRVVDANREIALMTLDMRQSKARLQPGEAERWRLTLRELDDAGYDDIERVLAGSEPWRADAARSRRGTAAQGFVAWAEGAPIGYMFYATASDPAPHPDLEWLNMTLGPTDVYTYDAFIPVPLRGRGPALFRTAYQRLVARGFTHAHGFCYITERPALFTYRMMGWQETGRIHEHRLLGKLAVVNGGLYRLNRFDRTRLVSLPAAVPDAVARLGAAIR